MSKSIEISNERTIEYKNLKRGVWLYFFLLIFEGALRKWVLPGLAAPLLIIRDPIAIWLILMSWKHDILNLNLYIFGIGFIGVISFITALLTGHGNLVVAVYGARVFLIQFPLIFIIGNVFTRQDVVLLGKVTLLISIPMAVLIGVQFFSPQSAWINRGLGGDVAGAGFSGALGYFRPPGTFSFTNGLHLFFSFDACFLFYFWLNPGIVKRATLIAATVGLITAIPFSISRSLFFFIAVAFLFSLIAVYKKPKYFGRMFLALLGLTLVLVILQKTAFFQTSTEAFFARFENASESEGGVQGTLGDRYLGGMLGALYQSSEKPFFGQGIGMGTNVGAQLLAGNREVFLISEEEWGRLIGELGPLMGIAIIFLRLHLTIKLAIRSYRKLKLGDILPWILLSFCLLTLPQAQWGQPTALGFSVLIAGLILASLKPIQEIKVKIKRPIN